MASGNPALRTFDQYIATRSDCMTIGGTVVKTIILMMVLLAGFGWVFNMTTQGYTEAFTEAARHPLTDANGKLLPTAITIPQSVYGYATTGVLGGFVLAMIIIFTPTTASFLSPIYAFLEGMALGAISAGFEARYPGIAMQAAGATFGTLIGMLVLYSTGIIHVTPGFVKGLLAAMLGILGVYIIDLVLQLFGGSYVPVVHSAGPWGIAFSAVVVVIAAFNLVVDFATIEESAGRAPKYMEWYGAFGLMVTLVWLYLEILRLLAKLRNND